MGAEITISVMKDIFYEEVYSAYPGWVTEQGDFHNVFNL